MNREKIGQKVFYFRSHQLFEGYQRCEVRSKSLQSKKNNDWSLVFWGFALPCIYNILGF